MNPEPQHPQQVEIVVKKPTINAKLLSIALGMLLVVAIIVGSQQCSRKDYWHARTVKLKADSSQYQADRVRWQGDSTKFVGVIVTQQGRIDKALNQAANWETKFYGQVAISDQQVDKLSFQAKQVVLLRELVNNKTLSPIYLGDTVKIMVQDTAILTAITKTAKRAALAVGTVDSLLKVVATQGTEMERLDARYNKARESSLFAQEKMQDLSEPKPLFSESRRKKAKRYRTERRLKRESDVSDLERVLNK
jgi:hypothetical protein